MTLAKICGLKTARHVETAITNGAAYVGFVFFGPSPRDITPEAATPLAAMMPKDVKSTGLFVKQSPDEVLAIAEAVALDAIQLHGTYSPEQVGYIKARSNAELLMAFGISEANDFDKLTPFEALLDRALFDAKPPKGSTLPGGNAVSFDWSLLANRKQTLPWMLAGGLTPTNVARAIALTNAPAVDVSSGVESAPGVKSSELIAAFLTQVAAP